jgi:ABC-type polysaccharide/polyol phosphate transport system ATPase subunit
MAAISLDNVSLAFPVFNSRTTSLRHQLIRLGTGGLIGSDAGGHKVVTALSEISIQLRDGDRVGLIGHNGSGKSTLMRLMAGIYHPTSGRARVDGRVSTIFELGVGADPDLSGMENILRIGVMMGLSHSHTRSLVPRISEFTELGDFLELPVRTYSAGMAMRLYFAMALFSDPEILLIDEVFGAGDAAFQKKAQTRLEQQIFDSHIFLFASHSPELIRRFCDRCIVMSHGKMVCFEQTDIALAEYEKRAADGVAA